MTKVVGLLCALALLSGTTLAQEELEKKLAGDWSFVSGKKAGVESQTEALAATVTIKDGTFILPVGPDMTFVMSFKLDTAENPAHIDMEIKEGPAPEGQAVGIIKFKDGKLMLCYNASGGERPTEFSSTQENGNFLFELKKSASKFDAEKLIGNWNYVSGKRAGDDVNEQSLSLPVSISKDEFTVPAGPEETFAMAYKIDSKHTPVHIDLEIKEGPADGKALGIIKIEGDKFTLCYDPAGENRPEKFESTADNGFFLFVLERGKQ